MQIRQRHVVGGRQKKNGWEGGPTFFVGGGGGKYNYFLGCVKFINFFSFCFEGGGQKKLFFGGPNKFSWGGGLKEI